MNGWTPATPLQTRISNLILQIPQEYRARACQECYGENDHDFERKLTAYVLHRVWETYESPIAEASRIDAELWDFTPVQNMPIIDMDTIKEIPI